MKGLKWKQGSRATVTIYLPIYIFFDLNSVLEKYI